MVSLRCIAVVLSLSPLLPASEVHLVGPNAEFPTIQAAVNAASEGDIVLVGEISEALVTIDGKGVTIIADDIAGTGFHRIVRMVVKNIAATQSVAVRGFQFSELNALFDTRVDVESCQGTVVFEDCQIDKGGPSVRVNHSAATMFVRCVIVGATGFAFSPGQHALVTNASNVFVYDSILEGGEGGVDLKPTGQIYPFAPTDGGSGAFVFAGTIFTSGTLISGGDGGDVISPFTTQLIEVTAAGDGGPAMQLNGGALWRRLQSPLIPGAAGETFVPNVAPGVAGVPLIEADSDVIVVPEFARRLELSSPIREGQTQTLVATGQPNEPLWLLFSFGAQAFYSPSLKGALLPTLPLAVLPLGQLDATGKLELNITIPLGSMPPGLAGAVIDEQAMFVGANSPILLSSPSVVVLLSSFH